MRLAWTLLVAHAVAALFGIAGMLVALRHTELWADNAAAISVFSFGMRWGGFTQIALGAAAVLVFGGATIGWRRTAIFAVVSIACSLAAELLGTGTGWPFGAYAYGDALGPKVFERVPIGIPLSWFSLGLTSYLLARLALARVGRAAGPVPSVLLAVWFFVVWDVVLDPAMAHERMPIRFWTWHEHGAFFGMPMRNLAGWAGTALVFTALSRALWRDEVDARTVPARFPITMYAVNLGFAMALDASVALWTPIVLALVLGLGPAWILAAPAHARRGRLTHARPAAVR